MKDTDRLLQSLEERVGAFPEVGTVFSTAGGSNKNQFARASNREHVGQLYVVMQDKRDQAAEERTIERIRNLLDGYPEVRHKFGRPMLFSFKAPIEVEIYGYDLAVLRDAADRVAARMENIRGLSDIQTSTQLGSPEIQIRFRRDRLARLNLEEGTVAGILRNKIRGEVASRYRVEDKQIDILVRAKESDRASIEDLKNLVVNRKITNNAIPRPNSRNGRERGRSGEEEEIRSASTSTAGGNGPQAGSQETTRSAPPIRLGAVADIVVGRGPSEVRRIRSQRAAVVSANLTGRDLNSVSNEIQEALGELRRELPPNTNVVLGGQNEELATSYRSLLLALCLAVFLVYLVMASQFESFIHPFIIIFTVPLSAVGVVLALFLTQTTLSVIAFLGVIILAGIVVNNAIVLIDYTNQLRRRGASKRDALLEAGQVRLRPILMTTLTTALGLAPMAVGWGEGSEVRAPMAVTVMGGLIFSTLLTLIFIPVIYELVDRKQYRAEDDEFDEAPGAA